MNRWLPIIALVILSAGPAAADEILGLPEYPGAESSPYQGSMLTNDVPLDAVVVMTNDEIHRVMEHYRRALEQRGVKVVEHMFGPGSGYIGYFDIDSGTMRLATSVTRPGGGTMIIFSSMDPLPLIQKTAQIPSDLPSLPDATNVVSTESQEASGRHRTVHFQIPGGKIQDTRTRLAEAAGSQGWKVSTKKKPLGGLGLELARGTERCLIDIIVMPPDDRGKVWTSITMVLFDQGNQGVPE
jgi:hypothetical protein